MFLLIFNRKKLERFFASALEYGFGLGTFFFMFASQTLKFLPAALDAAFVRHTLKVLSFYYDL